MIDTVTTTEGLHLLGNLAPDKHSWRMQYEPWTFFKSSTFFMTWESTYLSLSEDKFYLDKISSVNHS